MTTLDGPAELGTSQVVETVKPEMRWLETIKSTVSLNKGLFASKDRMLADLNAQRNNVSPIDHQNTKNAYDFIYDLTVKVNDAALSGGIDDAEIPVDLNRFGEEVISSGAVVFYDSDGRLYRPGNQDAVLRAALGCEEPIPGGLSQKPNNPGIEHEFMEIPSENIQNRRFYYVYPTAIYGIALTQQYDVTPWGFAANQTMALVGKNKLKQVPTQTSDPTELADTLKDLSPTGPQIPPSPSSAPKLPQSG